MDTIFEPRVRYSIYELQTLYEQGNKRPLEDVMRAWRGIKSLDPKDPRSFFVFAGYHGMPFRGEGRTDARYWGGYCAHGNVLFPTWHRAYLYKLEEALRSIPGCSNVTLPYWDQTDEYALKNGIPWPLTVEKFTLDGEEIDNPLRSYVLQEALVYTFDPNHGYSKPEAYETKRYPLAALVGTPKDIAETDKHNEGLQDYEQNVKLLNENVVAWMTIQAKQEYERCLEAPNYTVFSNTTSAAEFNSQPEQKGKPKYVPLESPHNHLHLAVGGFVGPSGSLKGYEFIKNSSGDMGENETAAFDPIFYFHHCNVDRVFWLWQKKYKSTDKLEILEGYPGTSTNDDQGPTPGYERDQTLGMFSPLYPFTRIQNGMDVIYTSNDLVNIEKQLGYTYSKGSLEDKVVEQQQVLATENVTKVCVSNLGKDQIKGSFTVECYLPVCQDDVRFLGVASVLSRWNLKACSNCQNHLNLRLFFDLPNIPGLEDPKPYAKIISRFGDTKTVLLKSSPEVDKVKEVEEHLVYQLL